MINMTVAYESYHFVGKGRPREMTVSYGVIIGEISTKYQIRNSHSGRIVWRLKDNVRFE